MNAGTLHTEWLQSTLLADNPLGDPSLRELPVYLPPGYGQGSRRYPVIYCLAGFTGNGRSFLNSSPFAPSSPERMDRLIREGCPEAILVFPDCFTRVGGSQYLDSSATGPYERYLLEEIVPHVDRTYRTAADARHRGVMGKSSGGYGAMMLAMRHPDVFSSFFSHSGDLYFEYCYKHDFPSFITGFWKHGSIRRFLDYFESLPAKKSSDINLLNIIGMAAAYSPNPDNPDMGIDLPMDLETGELRPEVWERWLELDPVLLVDRYAGNLRQLREVALDCGLRDEFGLHIGARIFSARLTARGISHLHREFDDGHMGTSYRYDLSFAHLSRVLSEGL